MNGNGATGEIRKCITRVIFFAPVVYAPLSDNENALEAGCNYYLSKPIDKVYTLMLKQKYFIHAEGN